MNVIGCIYLTRKVSKTMNMKANGSRRSDESLQKSSSAVPALASWYMVGWIVPALVSSLAGAIYWNDQQPLDPL